LLLLAMALLNDKTGAEDVVHDVFVSFVQGLDRFRLTGSLKGYLLTCTANRARNWNKAERRCGSLKRSLGMAACDADSTIATAGGLDAATRGVNGPLESLECNEQVQRLSTAMAELPIEQREVVMLHVHGALTFRTIAAAQAISANTAKSRYRYGIEKLRSILNGKVRQCSQQMK